MQESISLSKLTQQVKSYLKSGFNNSFWVVAEVSEMQEGYSGHCFLELIEKNEGNKQVIAKCKANIWAYSYRMIKPYFKSTTGKNIEVGMKLLVNVYVEFHEVYGFSLQVRNIDPSYTLGEIALIRQKTILKLKEEGVFDMNKELDLSETPNRIAIIASASSAGYGDFINQLKNNRNGYVFYTALFNALVQGNDAPASIISALERIYNYIDQFDAVIIIRGGGATSDLSCFDDYELSYFITQFPIPVITGIGHDRDEVIADMVAHTALKTPTAVAAFLIEAMEEAGNYIAHLSDKLHSLTQFVLDNENHRLANYTVAIPRLAQTSMHRQNLKMQREVSRLKSLATTSLLNEKNKLQHYTNRIQFEIPHLIKQEFKELTFFEQQLASGVTHLIQKQKNKLDKIQVELEHSNPEKLLKKGYSITSVNGKLVKDATVLKPGDILRTQFASGEVDSEVK